MRNKFKKAVATTVAAASLVTVGGVAAKQVKDKYIPKDNEYTIQTGDTLYDISNRFYGNSLYYDDIAEYNDIENADDIKAGDVIKLPNKIDDNVHMVENPVEYRTYTVSSGDSLISICDKFYNDNSYETALRLAAYNNIENADNIRIGQEIKLPTYDELLKVSPYPYDYEYDNAMRK